MIVKALVVAALFVASFAGPVPTSAQSTGCPVAAGYVPETVHSQSGISGRWCGVYTAPNVASQSVNFGGNDYCDSVGPDSNNAALAAFMDGSEPFWVFYNCACKVLVTEAHHTSCECPPTRQTETKCVEVIVYRQWKYDTCSLSWDGTVLNPYAGRCLPGANTADDPISAGFTGFGDDIPCEPDDRTCNY